MEFDLTRTIDDIAQAESSFDVFKQLKATGAAFDLPKFLVVAQPTNSIKTFAQRVVITNWDSELLARFIEGETLDRSRIADALRGSTAPTVILVSDHVDDENEDVVDDMRAMVERGYDRMAYFPFEILGQTKGAVSFTGMRGAVDALEMAQLAYVACHAFIRLMQVSAAETPHNPLTDREIAVFRLVADGLTAEEIGQELGITSHTVNYHTANAIHRLSAKNKIKALVTALQHGWLSESSH